ncbi:MAG: tol-pal system protein YbgF, partial [Pseudomonadota bacterium]
GDPSILFQEEESEQQGSLAPAPSQTQPANVGSGQTLGVLTTPISGQTDFDQGVAAAKAGDATTAQSLLQRFITANPGSPLIGDANFWLGESYYATGDFRQAARRYVDVADLYPGASTAPQSLMKLGVTLNLLGQADAACQALAEVGARYPNAAAAQEARAEAQRAGCG